MVHTSTSTPPTPGFSERISDRHHTVFSVRSCRDAVIWLGQLPGSYLNNSIKIHIGRESNTLVSISSTSSGVERIVETGGELNCDEDRYFWIIWSGDTVSVGRGVYTGSDVIVSVDDTVTSTLSQIFYESEENSTAQWSFVNTLGENVTFEVSQ